MRYVSAIAACALLAGFGSGAASAQAPAPGAVRPMHPVVMGLTSSGFADGGVIPDRYTRKQEPNVGSPDLAWTGTPPGRGASR